MTRGAVGGERLLQLTVLGKDKPAEEIHLCAPGHCRDRRAARRIRLHEALIVNERLDELGEFEDGDRFDPIHEFRHFAFQFRRIRRLGFFCCFFCPFLPRRRKVIWAIG